MTVMARPTSPSSVPALVFGMSGSRAPTLRPSASLPVGHQHRRCRAWRLRRGWQDRPRRVPSRERRVVRAAIEHQLCQRRRPSMGHQQRSPCAWRLRRGWQADLAVFRPGNGIWYIKLSSTNTGTSYQWGISTDLTVPGDYDGDGKADIAVFRPANGVWYIRRSSTNFATSSVHHSGVSSDVPVPSDFDGDGKTDVAVFRGASGPGTLALQHEQLHVCHVSMGRQHGGTASEAPLRVGKTPSGSGQPMKRRWALRRNSPRSQTRGGSVRRLLIRRLSRTVELATFALVGLALPAMAQIESISQTAPQSVTGDQRERPVHRESVRWPARPTHRHTSGPPSRSTCPATVRPPATRAGVRRSLLTAGSSRLARRRAILCRMTRTPSSTCSSATVRRRVYEMVTGRHAFGGTERRRGDRQQPPCRASSPSSIERLTPQRIDALVRHCLAKDPEARTQSMLDAFWRAWLPSGGSSRRRAGRNPSLVSRVRRHPVALLATAASAVAVAAALMVSRQEELHCKRLSESRDSTGDVERGRRLRCHLS